MLQFIMERNVLLYVLAAACAVGVVSQMILKQVYDRLIRDTRNTGEASGRLLQQLRQRFQYCTHLNEKVGDVQSLVSKSLMEYRFWGRNLHQWKRVGTGCLAISLLCAFGGTMQLVQNGANLVKGNTYFWMGVLAVALTAAAYGISDTGYREEVLTVGLIDYLENSGAIRDYSGQEEAEMYGTGREEAYGSSYTGDTEGATPIVSVAGGRKSKRRARAETAAAAEARGRAEFAATEMRRRAEYAASDGRGRAEMAAASEQHGRAELSAASETRAQREKRELKENLSRVRAGMQETAAAAGSDREGRAEILRQMDPKEQERILREVLKEFLS